MDYALSGLCIARIAAAGLRGETHAVRLYCASVPIGCAELRFALIPRRGIISIEKILSAFGVSLTRRVLTASSFSIIPLRGIEKGGARFSIDIIPLRGID
jgi:hypothetical protein